MGFDSALKMRIMDMALAKSGITLVTDHATASRILGFNMLTTKASYTNPDFSYRDTETITFSPDFLPFAEDFEMHVFFHELSHATGRAGRLERSSIANGYIFATYRERQIEEMIADTSANLLMNHFKLATSDSQELHFKYIETYSCYATPEENHLVLTEATRAMQYILQNWLSEIELPEQEAA